MDAHFLREAYAQAALSPDPSTQNGAVLVNGRGEIIGRGHNRFAAGVAATPGRLAVRAQKYPRTLHAEEGAIWDAVRDGRNIEGATLYVGWFCCAHCAIAILESGIGKVVGHADHPGVVDQHGQWKALVEIGLGMLDEAGFPREYHSEPGGLGCAPIRMNYEYWTP